MWGFTCYSSHRWDSFLHHVNAAWKKPFCCAVPLAPVAFAAKHSQAAAASL